MAELTIPPEQVRVTISVDSKNLTGKKFKTILQNFFKNNYPDVEIEIHHYDGLQLEVVAVNDPYLWVYIGYAIHYIENAYK